MLPYGANGWQLCAALYGVVYGLRLFSPEKFGTSQATLLLNAAKFPSSQALGFVVVIYSLLMAALVLAFSGRTYWCPLTAALSAVLWTVVGTTQVALEISSGHYPSWGVYEVILGIGCAVATVQRARDNL